MLRLIEPVGGVPLYRLKIKLRWSKPPIWRRIVVRSSIRLDRLHDLIQSVMPWTNSHLHQYLVGQTIYGMKDMIDQVGLYETCDEKKYTLADIAPQAKSKFIYEYDFGDGWEHEIVVEKVLPPDANFKHPVCLAGALACPPDDCGGMSGYYHLLYALAHRKHPDHAHLKEWIGGKWDPEHFDLDAINQYLKQLKA
jgi:hypothetical protein